MGGRGVIDAQRIAENVIWRAWADAFAIVGIDRINRQDMAEAYWWLIAPDGEWAESRAAWCAAAGVCPDKIRDLAIKDADAYRAAREALDAHMDFRAARARALWGKRRQRRLDAGEIVAKRRGRSPAERQAA